MVILAESKPDKMKEEKSAQKSKSLKNSRNKKASNSKVEQSSKRSFSFSTVSDRLENLCSGYDHFILPDSKKSDQFKELAKILYEHEQDALKSFDISILPKFRAQTFKPLASLFTKGFDNEQIWQQLEVFNKPFLDQIVSEISNLSSRKALLTLNVDKSGPEKKTDKSELSKSILKTSQNNLLPEKENKLDHKSKKVKFTTTKDALDPDFNQNEHPDRPLINQENVDFFNLDEMEAFLDAEDRKEMNVTKPTTNNEDEEDIDYFAELSDSEEDDDENDTEKDAMYSDFFDAPKSLTTTIEEAEEREDDDEEFNEADDDELDTRDFKEGGFSDEDGDDFDDDSSGDDSTKKKDSETDKFDSITKKLKALANDNLNEFDENDPSKSEYERDQLKLRQKIDKAERELLHPAALNWRTAGETHGDSRPENSLLEEHLQFDHISKPALLITDQTTLSLESIIKQRIKDKVFDDVERKEKPNEQPFEFRRRIMLESEKSKVGLAEVYEQEYMKKQQQLKEQEGTSSSMFTVAGEVEETETRKEIRRLVRGLFRKLDSLSAFHYTPRPPEPEVKIVSNMPAISVEEVTPDTVNDMKLLAPEEVFNTRGKKVLQAKGERTSTDRKRARRIKKKKQGIKQSMENKIKSKANSTNKVEIEKLKRNPKSPTANLSKYSSKKELSSSTKFFEKLQESKETGKVQKRKKTILRDSNLAKKLKL